MNCSHLGHIITTKHQIKLLKPTRRPLHLAPYRIGPKTSKLEKTKIGKMLEENIIEPAQTKWASLIVFAPKKDCTSRIYVDYRKCNVLTKRDSYSIPRTNECIDSLGNTAVFSILDANSGYCRIETDEADRDKTACTFPHRLYPFI